jgi:hypothetical protein
MAPGYFGTCGCQIELSCPKGVLISAPSKSVTAASKSRQGSFFVPLVHRQSPCTWKRHRPPNIGNLKTQLSDSLTFANCALFIAGGATSSLAVNMNLRIHPYAVTFGSIPWAWHFAFSWLNGLGLWRSLAYRPGINVCGNVLGSRFCSVIRWPASHLNYKFPDVSY